MFMIKRNQVIVTALAVMIAVAGYLNFTESRGSEKSKTAMNLTDEGDAVAILDDFSTLPDDDPDAVAALDPITAEASATTGDGAAVFVSAENVTSDSTQFFAQAKLDREQARAKQKDILTEMMNNNNVQEEKKAQCADNMLELQKRVEKETAAEAMIEAKGFKEAYVRIDDETVDVVVDKAELTDAEIAQIEDIVKRKTGVAQDKIRISPLKKAK
jgi:stage III sporulation protein AH